MFRPSVLEEGQNFGLILVSRIDEDVVVPSEHGSSSIQSAKVDVLALEDTEERTSEAEVGAIAMHLSMMGFEACKVVPSK